MEEGAQLYQKHCRFCHGSKGTAGKRLEGNSKLESSDYLARVVLSGPGYMTAFGEKLSDEEIAIIGTFVRNAWGNNFGPISKEEVAAVRRQ